MAKTIDKFLYAILIYEVVFYLKSEFHFDDGTINAILETGSFYVKDLSLQLMSFKPRL